MWHDIARSLRGAAKECGGAIYPKNEDITNLQHMCMTTSKGKGTNVCLRIVRKPSTCVQLVMLP